MTSDLVCRLATQSSEYAERWPFGDCYLTMYRYSACSRYIAYTFVTVQSKWLAATIEHTYFSTHASGAVILCGMAWEDDTAGSWCLPGLPWVQQLWPRAWYHMQTNLLNRPACVRSFVGAFKPSPAIHVHYVIIIKYFDEGRRCGHTLFVCSPTQQRRRQPSYNLGPNSVKHTKYCFGCPARFTFVLPVIPFPLRLSCVRASSWLISDGKAPVRGVSSEGHHTIGDNNYT